MVSANFAAGEKRIGRYCMQPPMSNYPQGDIVLIMQGQDDFWKGNIYERK